MLNEHTLDQLRSLRLDGMVRAIEEQTTSTAAVALGFDERLRASSMSYRSPMATAASHGAWRSWPSSI